MTHPPLTPEQWRAIRQLLRIRQASSEEREALRILLAFHGQLGSLVRLPRIDIPDPEKT